MIYRMGEYIPTVQDKIKPRTHTITEHYLDRHDNLKHIAQRIGGRIPNCQDKIKNRTHKIKDHIPVEHDNIKLMTHRMKSEWTRQIK